MIKSPASLYKPGRRGRDWLKLKRAIATLDVVVTAVEVGHGKRRNLLSDYTFAVRRSEQSDELLNIGKAYSGLTDVELADLTRWFQEHTIREFAHGRVRLVEPKSCLRSLSTGFRSPRGTRVATLSVFPDYSPANR